jgi:alpha-galactosidase
MALEHPEYFLDSGDENHMSLMLDLGNPDAWQYCYDTLEKLIGDLHIDCYRQDFNFEPLAFWRKKDGADRRGISEIKYINGFYKLWDDLLEKFPHLIIDNCASGGRRIDIETLRRSIPLWRSDYQCAANYDSQASQCHQQNFSTWMPYSGTGAGRQCDEYRVRSAYGAALQTGFTFSERNAFCDDEKEIAFIQKYLHEYLKVRPYITEDFYPLTEFTDRLDAWCASQYNRPDQKDGVIQVFRRENSPFETAAFPLRGLDAEKEYEIVDADDDSRITISGKELMENGFRVSISQRYKAKIFFYHTK